jgi:predicted metal-binding membrane protein
MVAMRFGAPLLLLALAGALVVDRTMTGMDAGPWTALGSLPWFTLVWVSMMAAMMLPSTVPATALYGTLGRARPGRTGPAMVFAAGYLLVWLAVGLMAFAADAMIRRWAGAGLDWNAGGRWVASGALVLAAAWQVTPLKRSCLSRCRSPVGVFTRNWRHGWPGALALGARLGGWCVGCCWALMLALFALGVMSITWMVVVAVVVALEKVAPWPRAAALGAAVALAALAVGIGVAPAHVPGLTVPGTGMADGMGMG